MYSPLFWNILKHRSSTGVNGTAKVQLSIHFILNCQAKNKRVHFLLLFTKT